MTDQTTPLRDRIAEAALTAVEAALGDTLVPAARAEALAGIAAVLPAPADHDTDTSAELASLAVNAGRALQDEKRHCEIACRENTRLRAMVDEYGDGAGALTRKLKRVRDLHRETCPLVKGEVPSGFKCGMCELLDAPAAPLRRVADETATTETQAPHRPVALATPCTVCGHTYNWHTRRHGQCEVVPLGVSRCGCTGFVPGERPEPVDPRRILGADPDFAAGARQDGAQ